MNPRKLALAFMTMLYFLLFAGGVVSYSLMEDVPDAAGWAGPAFLFAAFAVLLLSVGGRLRWWLAAVFAGGIIAEIVGLHTSFLFGNYTYTDALGWKLLGVPVSIGAAWAVLLACAASLSRLSNRFLGAAIGAGWMVVADLLIDPLASGPLGYWQWNDSGEYFGIPVFNFTSWFIVSYLLLLLLPRQDRLPAVFRFISLSIVVFYGLLALVQQGFQWLGFISLLLLVTDFVVNLFITRLGISTTSGFGKIAPLRFVKRTSIPVQVTDLYGWHAEAGAFDRLKPPWQRITILKSPTAISPGEEVSVRLHFGPISVPWVSTIVSVDEYRSFIDEQQSGPWAFWRHEHNFVPGEDGSSIMEDVVEYKLPGGMIGELLGSWIAEYELHRLFGYRHQVLLQALCISE